MMVVNISDQKLFIIISISLTKIVDRKSLKIGDQVHIMYIELYISRLFLSSRHLALFIQ